MFSSKGAYSRYIAMDLQKQRNWDAKRAEFLRPTAYWSRCRYYLVSYFGGVGIVSAVVVSGSLAPELVWWFVSILVLAPVVSWLVLRAMDWFDAKKRRLLHKRRLGSARMKVTQRNYDRRQQWEQAPKEKRLGGVVGGSRRRNRVPRAEMQKRKEAFKSEQAERKEKITQQKQELSDEIEMFEAALEEEEENSELRERAQVQIVRLREQMAALAPHRSMQNLQASTPSESSEMIASGVQKQLKAQINQIREGIQALQTPKERASAQQKVENLQMLINEVNQ